MMKFFLNRRFFKYLFTLLLGIYFQSASLYAGATKVDCTGSTVYPSFEINVSDPVQSSESIATIRKIISLHHAYNVPVNLYFNDMTFQSTKNNAPDLIEQLKISKVAHINYHLRPPYPYYDGHGWTDWLGLSSYNSTELEKKLTDYETYSISIKTGKVRTSVSGGYSGISSQIGYALPIVTQAGAYDDVSKTLAKVYENMGATITVSHENEGNISECSKNPAGNMYLRPENMTLKLFLASEDYSGKEEEMFATYLETEGDTVVDGKALLSDAKFLTLKWHEHDFYTTVSPWSMVYYVGPFPEDTSEGYPDTLPPPWSYSSSALISYLEENHKKEKTIELAWKNYEAALSFVSTCARMKPIGSKDLIEILKSDCESKHKSFGKEMNKTIPSNMPSL